MRTVLLPGLMLVSAACLALAALAVYQVRWIAPELNRIQDGIAQSFDVIEAARALERALGAAERGERNYLITGEAGELARARSLGGSVPALVAKLHQLVLDGPTQKARVGDLEAQAGIALGELRRLETAYAARGRDAAREALREHLAVDTMGRIAKITDAIVAAEDARLARLQHRAAHHEETFASAALGAGVLAIVVMGLGIFQLMRAFRNVRLAAEEYRMSEARFRLFVRGVTDYAVYTMDTEGRVTSWNAGAERIKGWSEREMLGRSFARFYTEEDQKAGTPRRALETAVREGRFETEALRVRKDGSRFWAHVVIDPIRDEGGRLLGFVKVTRDVTERRAQQATLEQVRSALAQAQKMEALGQLTGGIAHDFNNLLTVIMGSLEALERRLQAGRVDVAKLVESARRGADRAADLVQRLLAFARRQPLEPRPINPNALVNGVAVLMRRALSEAIAVETVLAAGAWWVSADRSQLENAVLNLAINSRDAMPEGGKLTIETANAFLDEAYARGNETEPGEYLLIAVSDTGTGMTAEAAARAFEPFFTTKDVGEGSGLGLSQVYGFAKQSNGHVKIYSEPGAGTVVKLYLPRLKGEVPVEDRPEAPAAPRAAGGETVLLVEDDEEVRVFAASALRELGYRVLQAEDAAAALGMVEAGGGIDLLLTDVVLPGGTNGRKLADAARERRPGLKVLFTSGYARNAIVHNGVLDAGVHFIGKPFTQSGLARRVREVLDRS